MFFFAMGLDGATRTANMSPMSDATNKADTVKFGKKITGYDDDIQSEEYDDVMPMMSVSMKFDPESTDVVAESLIDLEIAKTKIDLSKYYTDRFLPTVR